MIELRPTDEAAAALSASVEARGIVLVGETHGVVENAAVLRWLVRRFGPVQVGLECLAHGRELDPSELRPTEDGRITRALVEVVLELLEAGLVTSLAGFVPDHFSVPPDDRSQNGWEMVVAERLLALRDHKSAMIAFAGSVHALVTPQPLRGPGATAIGRRFAQDPAFASHDAFYPMGWHVARAEPTLPVRIRYGRGTYNNFGVKRFRRDRSVTDNCLQFRDGQVEIHVLDATAAV